MTWILEKTTNYGCTDVAFSNPEEDKLCVVGDGGIIEYYDPEVLNGLNERIVSPLAVYPNPGHNAVYIQDIGQEGLLRVYNTNGQLCRETPIQSDQAVINTTGLFPGTYFFLFSNENQSWAGKWVKKD